jgi:uncharacterized surface protein with fasciclin (FAS1) repeats
MMRLRNLCVLAAPFILASASLSGVALAQDVTSPPAPPSATEAPVVAPQPSMTIVETAVASGDFTTLVKALKAAGLAETLSSTGPFTVFAPTDAAFAALPTGTVEGLLKPKNKSKLSQVLTYHVVGGKITSAQLISAITEGGGTYSFKTVNGEELIAKMADDKVVITDSTGASATVTTADLDQTNGVIHVIDKVLMPK